MVLLYAEIMLPTTVSGLSIFQYIGLVRMGVPEKVHRYS